MANTWRFSEPSALDELRPFFTARRGVRRRVVLDGRLAAHEESAAWERDLNRNHLACGCDVGTIGALAGIGIAAVVTVESLARDRFGWQALAVLWIVSIVLASGVGKTIGLFRANRRLNALVSTIQRTATERRSACGPAVGSGAISSRQAETARSESTGGPVGG